MDSCNHGIVVLASDETNVSADKMCAVIVFFVMSSRPVYIRFSSNITHILRQSTSVRSRSLIVLTSPE